MKKKNLKAGNIRTQMISNSWEFHHFVLLVSEHSNIVFKDLSKTLKIVIGQRILNICIGNWSFHHSAIQDSKSFLYLYILDYINVTLKLVGKH